MSDFSGPKNDFFLKLRVIIEENLGDENFGVSELAEKLNMSRSNLLRKVKNDAGVSVSVFIRQVRLFHARQMLLEGSLTVSEISYKVGFNSTSYFTKCFREEYGYTPGAEGKLGREEVIVDHKEGNEKWKFPLRWLAISIVGIVIVFSFWLFRTQSTEVKPRTPKSIAVLPFKNDSNDSTNVYLMNGLMEAILNNFQKIEDVKVTSRTTVERYRDLSVSIPDLARQLEIDYFVEGSGQKIGNEIVLTIQLIEASTDRHLWSQRYQREIDDIFKLQMEIAGSIAREIEIIITPEEQRRIEKVPTQNLVAYDFYLKGLEHSRTQNAEGLSDAIEYFKKAINEDGQFAHAYAYVAICYYYWDIYRAEKEFKQELKSYADQAMKLDSDLAESQIAMALYYMQNEEYEKAVRSFEEVLIYYPNSGWVHNFLSDIYTSYLPDTDKYLTHALMGIQSAVANEDSATASFTYLHLSNALAQTGFVDEAEKYGQKSLRYNPNNLYSQYLLVFIHLAQDFDAVKAKKSLLQILQKDTTRIDVVQEVAKMCYTMKDYKTAWIYYDKLIKAKEVYNLDIYQSQDANIGFVLEQLGRESEAQKFYDSYHELAKKDKTIYKDVIWSAHYALNGDVEKGMTHLKIFSEEENIQYWVVLFLDKDPIMMKLAVHPDFDRTIKKIQDRFWAKHRVTRQKLKAEGVF